MKKFLIALIPCLLIAGCNQAVTKEQAVPEALYVDTASERAVEADEEEMLNLYTVQDEDTGEILVEIYSSNPIKKEYMVQCGADIVESQRKIEAGEITVSYPEQVTEAPSLSEPYPERVFFVDSNGNISSSVTVTRQADPDLMDVILARLGRLQAGEEP